MTDHTSVEVSEIPNCDFCREIGMLTPAVVDGRTRMGPWAYMCGSHWRSHGVGTLGLGFGQTLIKKGLSL